MATRELDKEGAERQVLRYRFAEQTIPGSLNGAGFRYKKSVLFRRVYMLENFHHPLECLGTVGNVISNSRRVYASWPVPSTS